MRWQPLLYGYRSTRAADRAAAESKKTDVAEHLGVPPRRLTRQRAPRHSRVTLQLVIRRLLEFSNTPRTIVRLGTSTSIGISFRA